MQRYKKWTMAGASITLIGLFTGCGNVGGGSSSSLTPTNTVSNSTSVGNASNSTPSNTPTMNSTITNRTTANNTQLHSQKSGTTNTEKVYVFTQPVLKEMYAALYVRSVGPIVVPNEIAQKSLENAPRVSMNMLQYAPINEQALDKELIQSILNYNQNKPMGLLKLLPGYKLHTYSTPQGGPDKFWFPEGQWAQWTDPVVK